MRLAPGEYRVEWVTLATSQRCTGCGVGLIPTGRRALRFLQGRGTARLAGQWFHGYGCLGNRAELLAVDEDDVRPGDGEPFRDLAHWAQAQDRAHRDAGRI